MYIRFLLIAAALLASFYLPGQTQYGIKGGLNVGMDESDLVVGGIFSSSFSTNAKFQMEGLYESIEDGKAGAITFPLFLKYRVYKSVHVLAGLQFGFLVRRSQGAPPMLPGSWLSAGGGFQSEFDSGFLTGVRYMATGQSTQRFSPGFFHVYIGYRLKKFSSS